MKKITRPEYHKLKKKYPYKVKKTKNGYFLYDGNKWLEQKNTKKKGL